MCEKYIFFNEPQRRKERQETRCTDIWTRLLENFTGCAKQTIQRFQSLSALGQLLKVARIVQVVLRPEQTRMLCIAQKTSSLSSELMGKLMGCRRLVRDYELWSETSINQWISKAGGEAGKLLRSLRDQTQQWWYFLDHPEVPPDNNLAERWLRLAVTKRKVSGGSP